MARVISVVFECIKFLQGLNLSAYLLLYLYLKLYMKKKKKEEIKREKKIKNNSNKAICREYTNIVRFFGGFHPPNTQNHPNPLIPFKKSQNTQA